MSPSKYAHPNKAPSQYRFTPAQAGGQLPKHACDELLVGEGAVAMLGGGAGCGVVMGSLSGLPRRPYVSTLRAKASLFLPLVLGGLLRITMGSCASICLGGNCIGSSGPRWDDGDVAHALLSFQGDRQVTPCSSWGFGGERSLGLGAGQAWAPWWMAQPPCAACSTAHVSQSGSGA
jgi:hypothetical protein